MRYQIFVGGIFIGLCGLFYWYNDHGQQSGAQIRIVATTSIIADMVKNIVGDAAEVTALMGPGVDPHTYKARDHDLELLSQADILIFHGLHLEGRMVDLFADLSASRPVIAVTHGISRDRLRRIGTGDVYDPHVWFDVALWMEVVRYTTQSLAAFLPEKAELLYARSGELLQRYAQLDAECRLALEEIAPDRRAIVTAHDAFAYFGLAYGCEVYGLQGISTESDVSVRDIIDLADTLLRKKISVIFAETAVSHKGVEAVVRACEARQWPVVIADELYTDALGPVGSGADTYEGMVRSNLARYKKALTGSDSHE